MSTQEDRRFYASSAWRRTRQNALSRDGGLCVICRKHGKVVPATEIDHITPIKEREDLKLDINNLQSLCHDCHTRKTAADARPSPRFCIHGMNANECRKCKNERMP